MESKANGEKRTDEEKKLAIMMMPKKKKALYDKIMYSKQKKASQVFANLFALSVLRTCHMHYTVKDTGNNVSVSSVT